MGTCIENLFPSALIVMFIMQTLFHAQYNTKSGEQQKKGLVVLQKRLFCS